MYNLLLQIVPSLVTEDGAFCHMVGLGNTCIRVVTKGYPYYTVGDEV